MTRIAEEQGGTALSREAHLFVLLSKIGPGTCSGHCQSRLAFETDSNTISLRAHPVRSLSKYGAWYLMYAHVQIVSRSTVRKALKSNKADIRQQAV